MVGGNIKYTIDQILSILQTGEDLDYELCTDIFTILFDVSDLSQSHLVTLLQEVSGRFYSDSKDYLIILQVAVSILRERMLKLDHSEEVIDVCGTGGDKKNLLNISTAVSLVLASCGIKIAKHGNKAITSQSGSADVLANAFLQSNDTDVVLNSLKEVNISFLYAPYFHPIIANVAPVRKQIKERTVFNILGPLINPMQPKKQLIGVFNQDTAQKIANFIAIDNQIEEAYVVSSLDGMDEVSIFADTHCYYIKNGVVHYQIISPELFGLTRYSPSDLPNLLGKDAIYNLKKLTELLDGKAEHVYSDMVLLNSAVGFCLSHDLEFSQDSFQMCENALLSGKAKVIFEYFS